MENPASVILSRLMDETLYKSTGVLRYSETGLNLRLDVDQGISDYYRALVPKWINLNRQAYPAHISLVRKEVVPNMDVWRRHEGERIEFCYSPHIHHGKVYYWLNCFCTRLEEIRLELGLPVSSEYTLPPEGWTKCFHMTIGNLKEI
jgi:hypothetical protein